MSKKNNCGCDGLDVRLCAEEQWLVAEINEKKPNPYKRALAGCYTKKEDALKDLRNVYSANKMARVITQKDFDELKIREIALK